MKYVGNIGNLLNSIYVRDKLPKSRKSKAVIRKTAKKIIESDLTTVSKKNDVTTIQTKLFEIRNLIDKEERNKGNQTEIKEGFVYIVTNPIFSGWVKAGMTTDYEKRLQTYNVGDPFNSYNMRYIKWVSDRREAEDVILNVLKFKAQENRGEWFKIDEDIAQQIVGSLVL